MVNKNGNKYFKSPLINAIAADALANFSKRKLDSLLNDYPAALPLFIPYRIIIKFIQYII